MPWPWLAVPLAPCAAAVWDRAVLTPWPPLKPWLGVEAPLAMPLGAISSRCSQGSPSPSAAPLGA